MKTNDRRRCLTSATDWKRDGNSQKQDNKLSDHQHSKTKKRIFLTLPLTHRHLAYHKDGQQRGSGVTYLTPSTGVWQNQRGATNKLNKT